MKAWSPRTRARRTDRALRAHGPRSRYATNAYSKSEESATSMRSMACSSVSRSESSCVIAASSNGDSALPTFSSCYGRPECFARHTRRFLIFAGCEARCGSIRIYALKSAMPRLSKGGSVRRPGAVSSVVDWAVRLAGEATRPAVFALSRFKRRLGILGLHHAQLRRAWRLLPAAQGLFVYVAPMTVPYAAAPDYAARLYV